MVYSNGPNNIAERLSARLLIVQCACMCIYIYLSHFNCVGAVSVVSSPDC